MLLKKKKKAALRVGKEFLRVYPNGNYIIPKRPSLGPTPRHYYCPTLVQAPHDFPNRRLGQTGSPRSEQMAAAAGAATRPALVVGALVAALMMLGSEAVWLDLPPTGTKCVSEEIQPNVVVVADYMLMYEAHATAHPTVAVKVSAARSPPFVFACLLSGSIV